FGWRCGLSICFDLRFPRHYASLRRQGAHVLLAPSNFTRQTGEAHWDLLTRARAVETQCFVLAPNQCGQSGSTGVASYGHSVVVGPWGEPLALAGTEPAVLRTVLEPGLLATTRRRILMED